MIVDMISLLSKLSDIDFGNAKVIVNAIPSDAKITLNGIIGNKGTFKLYSKVHIKVEKLGYETIEKDIVILSEDTITINIELSKDGNLYVNISPEHIWINDIPVEVFIESNTYWDVK